MNNFDYAIDVVLKNEGGLEENENDAGGITNHGISLRLLKSIDPNATADDIRNLTEEQAIGIYKSKFWSKAPFEQIKNLRLCAAIFDMAINSGLAPTVKCAQRACNSLLAEDYQLNVDAKMGCLTLNAINTLDQPQLLAAFRAQRETFYRDIVANNPSQEVFLNGWLKRAET